MIGMGAPEQYPGVMNRYLRASGLVAKVSAGAGILNCYFANDLKY